MGNTGYSNEIKILKRQIEVLERQVTSLISIDSKLDSQSIEDTQLDNKDSLISSLSLQQEQLDVSKEILKLIKEIGNIF